MGRAISERKYGGTGLISETTEAMYAELIKRAETVSHQ